MPRSEALRLAVLLFAVLPLCSSAAGLRSAATVEGASPPAASSVARSDRYGPVQATDTLWSIAERVRPAPRYSVQQTMLAIMDVNPGAFSEPNVNALKTGVMLKIPTAEQVGRRSKAQALAEVKRQYAQWQTLQQNLTRTPAPSSAQGPATKAPARAPVQAKTVPPSRSTGVPGAAAGQSSVLGNLRTEVQKVTEEAETAKAHTETLKARVKGLESEVNALKQSVQKRESTLARLQQQLAETGAVPAQATATEVAPAVRLAPPPAPAQRLETPKRSPAPRVAAAPAAATDPMAVVDKLLKKLPSANIAFNAPKVLNVDETAAIQLVMGVANSVEQLKRLITAAGEKQSAHIKVADRVEARLSGAGFTITAITPEVQAVSGTVPTEWKWDVKPVATGAQVLHLTVSVLLDVDGTPTRRAIRTFDRSIQVQVTATQWLLSFFEGNWQWLWAAILVPAAGYAWRRWQRGRRRSSA